ncbi:hypothetical protein E3N88_09125 [Mikania micrantha]|uniref:Uncharacterized protein n=1 Tax=Mikania micrantha TaxID=192012 RepID=A0A5N6PI56_9ASTR|nr:hypothetical protein E3N88_09125 [Mikania micrantha]
MFICLKTKIVIEKYAKNGPKHENGPNWAGSKVQAVPLTRCSTPGDAREAGKRLGCRLVRAVRQTLVPLARRFLKNLELEGRDWRHQPPSTPLVATVKAIPGLLESIKSCSSNNKASEEL